MSNSTTNNTIIESLTDLGLGQNEAKLYEILLKTPKASIPDLLKTSPFSRTLLYYILGGLEGFGLIKTAKEGKKTVYVAEPPEKLQDFVFEQEKELQRQKSRLGDVMKDLRSVYQLGHNQPGVRFFEGIGGVREVIFDSLKAKGEILTFLDVSAAQKYIEEINRDYVKERVRLGIKKRQIAPDTTETRARYQKYSPLLEVKLVPPDIQPFQTSIQIYNDTISFSTLNDKKMIGVIIEDKQIVLAHRSLFEYIWKTLPLFSNPKPIAPPNPQSLPMAPSEQV